jgi:hypothetical protein
VSESEQVHAARQALVDATEWPRQADQLRARADALDVQITLEMDALARLLHELAGEQREVDRYEGLSIRRVIASLIGRREQRLADEVSERDAVAMEVVVRNGALERLKAKARELRSQAGHPSEIQNRIRDARKAYLDALHAAGDPRGMQGLEMIEQIGRLRAARAEIAQAQDARADAEKALSAAASNLSSASSWSTYDTFFGGGMIADAIKRGHLRDATGAISNAQYAMIALAAELRDVEWSNPRPAAPQISSALGATDFWFDNIFSDWMVRDRISTSRQSVAETLGRLAELGGVLVAKAATAEADLEEAEARLADLFGGLTSPDPQDSDE